MSTIQLLNAANQIELNQVLQGLIGEPALHVYEYLGDVRDTSPLSEKAIQRLWKSRLEELMRHPVLSCYIDMGSKRLTVVTGRDKFIDLYKSLTRDHYADQIDRFANQMTLPQFYVTLANGWEGANLHLFWSRAQQSDGSLQEADPQFTAIISLTMNEGEIRWVPEMMRQFSGLRRVDLSENFIVGISPNAFKGLSQLNTLKLNDNSFSTLTEGVFDDLEALEELDLSGNQIHSLPADLFKNLKNLLNLNLYSNRLTAITPRHVRPLQRLQHLNLQNNPLDVPRTFHHLSAQEQIQAICGASKHQPAEAEAAAPTKKSRH